MTFFVKLCMMNYYPIKKIFREISYRLFYFTEILLMRTMEKREIRTFASLKKISSKQFFSFVNTLLSRIFCQKSVKSTLYSSNLFSKLACKSGLSSGRFSFGH